MTINNVPILRFKFFNEGWRSEKLGENINYVKGNNGDINNVPILTISASNGWMNQKERFGNVLAGNELKKYTMLSKNQLSYNHGNSKIAEYGVVFMLKDYDKALVPKVYHSFEVTDNNYPLFIQNLFSSKKPDRQLRRIVTSGARKDGLLNINEKSFSSIRVNLPSLNEQKYIVKFLSKLDTIINLHLQKLEQLKKLKRGYLQKMFPQGSETLPRLRFHGFSDKWMSHKFGDYLSIPKKEAIEVNDINQLMTIKLNFKGVYRGSTSSTLKLGSTKYYKRHKGQLIYGKQNFFHGSIAIIPDQLDGLATSSDVPSFNIDGMDKGYLYYYISRKDFYEKVEKYATGTGSKRLHENDFLELSFMVPSLEEQRKIAVFFDSIDNFIEIEKNKLAELKKQKKAYLQKMFI